MKFRLPLLLATFAFLFTISPAHAWHKGRPFVGVLVAPAYAPQYVYPQPVYPAPVYQPGVYLHVPGVKIAIPASGCACSVGGPCSCGPVCQCKPAGCPNCPK